MKPLLIIILLLLTAACGSGNPEDGAESLTSKREWSILQDLEFQNREADGLKFIFL